MKSTGFDSVRSWMVTFLCSAVNTVSLTPYRLVGLMFVSIVESYDTDRRSASVPIVLFMIIRCAGGPIFGVLGQRFGAEEVSLAGTFIAALGLGGCAIVRDIRCVIVFLGIVYGIGLGCSNANMNTTIKKHFTRNVSTANGFINAGSCIGAAIVPPLAYYVLEEYGVLGTFLIMSGIMLNAAPMAMIVKYASDSQEKLQKHPNQYCDVVEKNQESKSLKLSNSEGMKPEQYSEHKIDAEPVRKQLNGGLDCHSINPQFSPKENSMGKDLNSPDYSNLKTTGHDIEALCNVNIKDKNEEAFIESKNLSATKSVSPKNNTSNSSLVPIESTKQKTKTLSPAQKPNVPQRKRWFSIAAFKEASFLAVMVNVALHTYVTTLTWTTMVDYSRDKGISKNKEMYFLMLQPLLDFVGRTCLGWVTDHGYLAVPTFTVLGYIAMALSAGCVALSKNFETMLPSALVFAISSGSISTMFPGMIYKYVTEENQIVAQASRYFLFGFLAFTSSPVIGYFRMNLGSYDGLYYFMMFICLLSCLIIPLMLKFSKVAENCDQEIKQQKL